MAEQEPTPAPDPITLLNPRQRRFVEEYCLDFNATAAYSRSGFKSKAGMSTSVCASQLFKHPNVRAAVRLRLDALTEIAGLKLVELLEEIKLIATSDISHYRTNGPSVILAEGAPANAMRAISSIEHTCVEKEGSTEYRTKIRLWDKNAAIVQAGKYLGVFPERHRVGGDPDNKTPIPVEDKTPPTPGKYPIDELELDLDTRKKIREAILKREARKKSQSTSA